MKLQHLLAIAIALTCIRPAFAAPDPKATVEQLDNALLDVMKNADKLGYKGRYQKLDPIIHHTFDLPLMTRISVGPQWTSLTPDQQQKVIDAFTRLSIATYAARFDGYSGEQFQIVGQSPTSGSDQIVDTKMVLPKDEPVELNYRLRADNGDWKIIDVFLSGTISQLANYRSEFAATLRSKGADGLVTLIDQKVADLTPKG
ncbi:MAG TPA: ABC transporter substrate-binding protein [Alphaproteobacteria bacterium]|nr:ABC transporter substrate-binding protein [Alphaproteobacteria bacterium]